MALSRTRQVALAVTFAGAMALGAPAAAAAPLSTHALSRVAVSSYQALPPPLGSRQAVIKAPAALASFGRAVRADRIGTATHATTSPGCAGGTTYKVAVAYANGRHVSLSAYDCGGSVTGNMTGSVKKFLVYLSRLLSPAAHD